MATPRRDFAWSRLSGHHLSHTQDDFLLPWDGGAFQDVVVRHWYIAGADTQRWGIQIAKRFLDNGGTPFGPDTAALDSLVNDHQAVGLLDRVDDGLLIERIQRPWIDDLKSDSLAVKLFRRP